MNRRRFFSVLAAGVAGLAIDPERLVWTPGAKTHILPPAEGWKEIHDAQREYDRLRSMELDMRLKFVRHVNGEFPARIDVLYGMQMVKPELAVRINA